MHQFYHHLSMVLIHSLILINSIILIFLPVKLKYHRYPTIPKALAQLMRIRLCLGMDVF